MADFKHPFIDFSNGEVSEKLLLLSTSSETKNALSFLENTYTTKTKGLERRTGTIKSATTVYGVAPEYDNARSMSFYIGKDLSFVAMVYVTTFNDQVALGLDTDYADTGSNLTGDFYNLTFDFYKVEGDSETYLNTFTFALDPSQTLTPLFEDLLTPETNSLDWTNLYGWKMKSFQSLMLLCHDSGSVEPFFLIYAPDANLIYAQPHKIGLNTTNPDFYPNAYLSSIFSLPFEEPNLSPDLGIGIQRIGTDENQFTLRAQYYDPTGTPGFKAWSSVVTVSNKSHPFKNHQTYVRLTIGTSSYILRYIISGANRLKDLSDTTDPNYTDSHTFALVLDDRTTSLFSIALASPNFLNTSNFQLEAFNVNQGYPDNLIFYDQRLLFTRKGRIFNSNVGNAFFFNQYRLPQTTSDFVSLEITVPPSTLGYIQRPLLLSYSGTKTQQDAFDFIPSTEFISTNNWLNKSQVLEVGNFSGTQNITGTEDSIYSFDSIKASLGNSEGSRSTLSEKAKDVTLFLDSSNKKIYAYYYDGRQRTFISQDLMAFNENIADHNYVEDSTFDVTELEIVDMSFNVDDDILYCVIAPSNSLIALRYSRDEGINSWSRINLGNFEEGNVDIRSCSFVRTNLSRGFDYLVTKRDGKYYLEKFAKRYPYKQMNVNLVLSSVDVSDLPVYLDFCERQVSPTALSTWTLSSFYVSKTVDVFADGFWIKDVRVTGAGALILNREVKSITVGFRYKSKMQTLAIEPSIGGQSGSSLDMNKHINHHHLRVVNSYGGSIGHSDGSYLERIPYENTDMLVGTGLLLYTGPIEISPDQDVDEDVKGYIETDAPYPFELLAWVVKGEVNDG